MPQLAVVDDVGDAEVTAVELGESVALGVAEVGTVGSVALTVGDGTSGPLVAAVDVVLVGPAGDVAQLLLLVVEGDGDGDGGLERDIGGLDVGRGDVRWEGPIACGRPGSTGGSVGGVATSGCVYGTGTLNPDPPAAYVASSVRTLVR
ncbi:MAG: hypothetical protein JWR06_2869 [Jatrophihabitans sp.]|nr:hypothetical protein [Jatrophihabitans sp.]